MKLKLRTAYLLAALMLAPSLLFAQGGIAISLRNGAADPAQCQPTSLNVFLNRTTPVLKVCTAANTWTAVLAATGGVGNLASDGPNILAQRNGVNAQTFRIYNTFTDASNYERGIFDWGTAANVLTIGAKAAGSGTQRAVILDGASLNFQVAGATAWQISTGGSLRGITAAQGLLTAGTMTPVNADELRTVTSRYDWTNAMVTALGAPSVGDITVATLPAKTNVDDVKVVIDSPDTSANALTVACGVVATGYIDYVVASDAKAAANTVYGDATAERGTNMVIVGGHLPSYTGTTALNCHFVKTTSALSTVLGSTGHVIVTTRLLP